MKKRTRFIWVAVITLAILTGLLLLSNIVMCFINHSVAFLVTSADQILTLLTALFIAFVATQFRTDQAKTKEHAERIIQKLQSLVTVDALYTVNPRNDDEVVYPRNTLMTLRKINNCISILKQYSAQIGFEADASYIETEFDHYRALISDHINDTDFLNKCETELRRYLENIDSKCDLIISNLYK